MNKNKIKKKHSLVFLLFTGTIGLMILTSMGCGFHLREITEVPKEFKTIILNSSDPYGPLTQFIRQELRLNRVIILDDSQRTDLPTLRITGSLQRTNPVSIFQDGVKAENQLSLTVSAEILIPGSGIYPIQVTVFRSFLDNPLMTLPKEAENEILTKEMMKQAAKKLIRQFTKVHEDLLKDSKKPPTDIKPKVTVK
ncbi:LPS assembly lipoprotein LptE [Candidatus Williamhamiltonella defendens]|uniref:LPS-assembly lipoprotein LptE n=1 Tax=Candidatus Hamiltonella defensa (Bemisia tabaci) TaxID=672795 RepID=A0A249DXH2_9ENTR|nr:LPS assembly lipoprotein LptE [Candidatus Hamiltonella defensa]ASX26059.1 LPS assembly lipoprotein LptE [Candidatus Hamiltonella defensa (Bemisia tabaci)]